MTFDAFQQAKLMNAYKGAQNAVLPPSKELDNLDDLKRLAGVNNTSFGEETSHYASNLGQIQRERNIRPGSDEWFKLWFSKPILTGEQPYDK